MSPAARTVVSMQLSQASKLYHRRVVARLLSSPCPSDKSSMSSNSLRPPRALPCYSRPLNVKRCLPQRQTMSTYASSSVVTCKNLIPAGSGRFSLRGQRSYVELLRRGRKAWGRGYTITITLLLMRDGCRRTQKNMAQYTGAAITHGSTRKNPAYYTSFKNNGAHGIPAGSVLCPLFLPKTPRVF